MQRLGEINDRQVFYLKVNEDEKWFTELPNDNWLVLPICGENGNVKSYHSLADKTIDNKVLFACAVGKESELIHDIFDQYIVSKKLLNGESIESPDDFEDSPMTTADNNLDEGFWFALYSAFHGTKEINKVVCIDYTIRGVKNHLIDLLKRFHQGWIPSEDEVQLPKYDS